MPMRETIDSLVQVYSSHYNISTALDSVNGSLIFVGSDSLAQFKTFTINYDAHSNLLAKVDYSFDEIENMDSTGITVIPVKRTKRLTMEFSNYQITNYSNDIYDENKYVFFENHTCKPVSKYKDYRVFYYRKEAR